MIRNSLPLLILYVIGLHLMWGGALIFYSNSAVTLALLGGFDNLIKYIGSTICGIVLVAFALTAATALIFEQKLPRKHKLWALAALLPQYSIALFAVLSSIYAIVSGNVYSHEQHAQITVDRALLVIGVSPLIISGVLHTWAILHKIAYLNPDVEIADLYSRLAKLEKEH